VILEKKFPGRETQGVDGGSSRRSGLLDGFWESLRKGGKLLTEKGKSKSSLGV